MVYSKTCEYALRSLTYFANHPEAKSATVKDVSQDSSVPAAYVAKIFQCLAKSRILGSQRGAAGGYSLLIPAGRLTLLRVVRALDDLSKSPFSNCAMGFDQCNDRSPCPLHPIWTTAKDRMLERLHASTIADLAALGGRFRYGRQRRTVLSKGMRGMFSIQANRKPGA